MGEAEPKASRCRPKQKSTPNFFFPLCQQASIISGLCQRMPTLLTPSPPPPASPSPIHHPYRPSHSTLGHTQHHDSPSSLPRCTIGVLASEAHRGRGIPHFYLYVHSSKQKIQLNWVFTPAPDSFFPASKSRSLLQDWVGGEAAQDIYFHDSLAIFSGFL